MDKKLEYFLKKKGLDKTVALYEAKLDNLDNLVKKYKVTPDEVYKREAPQEVIEAAEEAEKYRILAEGATKYAINQYKKNPAEIEEFEAEFNGFTTKSKVVEEQQKSIDELQENFEKYGTQEALTALTRARIELNGKTPEERIINEERERQNSVNEALDRAREKTKEDEARKLADIEIRDRAGRESKEARMREALKDKRLMRGSHQYETRRDPLEVEIQDRKNELVKEAGLEQEY